MGTMLAALGGPREVKAVPENLSDLLPETLAIFVQQAGSDRRLAALTAEELEVLRDPELDARAFVALLGPQSITEVSGAARLVDVRGPLGSPTRVVAGPGTVVQEGSYLAVLPLGERFLPGETVHGGSLFNAGESTLVFEDADGNEIIIPPDGVLLKPCLRHCAVGCGRGKYACCLEAAGCVYCYCISDGKQGTECQAGGPGSNYCEGSIGYANSVEDPAGHEAE
jgi:hypothetical protein